MKVFAGCYERFVFSFSLDLDDEGSVVLSQIASTPAHKGAVKCMDLSGDFMATGGADDQIHLFDVRKDADLGFLMNPLEGPVPCLRFVAASGRSGQPSHMLTGSVEGPICIWKATGDWEYVKSMSGHDGAVNDLAVHPTGSVALSVSRDKQMRLWDLTKGKCAYQAPLGGVGDFVEFIGAGEMYAVATGTNMSIHTVKGETTCELKYVHKALCCTPLSHDTLLAGYEGGDLVAWDVRRPEKPLAALERAHTARVRALTRASQLSGHKGDLVAAASSDGALKIWSVRSVIDAAQGAAAGTPCVAPAAQLSVGARFTCLCLADHDARAVAANERGPSLARSRTGSGGQGPRRKRARSRAKGAGVIPADTS